ncbi:hypothetical protein ACYOEI_17115 [Singulisphaera rosea]
MMGSPRISLARLMVCVAAIAPGLAALRLPTVGMFGVAFLATGAVLLLAVVGAICRRGPSRAWWIGFALFGWGYLALVFGTRPTDPLHPMLVTKTILLPLKALILPNLQPPPARAIGRDFDSIIAALVGRSSLPGPGWVTIPTIRDPFLLIGQTLMALLAAVLGGVLGRALFGRQPGWPEQPEFETHRSARASSRQTPTPLAFGCRPEWILCGGAILVAATGMTAGLTTSPLPFELSSVVTAALLGLAVLAATMGPESMRARWLGAALFGWGAIALGFHTSVTRAFWASETLESRAKLPYSTLPRGLEPLDDPELENLMRSLENGFPQASSLAALLTEIPDPDGAVLKALERSVPLPFPNETPIHAVLAHIRSMTRSPELPNGLSIYVEPVALLEVEKTLNSPVHIDLADVPLSDSLRLVLRQLDLDYIVKGRLVLVMQRKDILALSIGRRYASMLGVPNTPFQNLAQCVLALLAAAVGSLAARFVAPDSVDPPTNRGPGVPVLG